MISTINNEHQKIEVLALNSNVRLLLNNVCKNAIVHSDGPIQISLQNQQAFITSNTSQKSTDSLVAGAGIGLIIATRAVDQMVITETDAIYELRLLFNA